MVEIPAFGTDTCNVVSLVILESRVILSFPKNDNPLAPKFSPVISDDLSFADIPCLSKKAPDKAASVFATIVVVVIPVATKSPLLILDESWTRKLFPVTNPCGDAVVNVVIPVTESNVDDVTFNSCPILSRYSPA